MAQFYIANQAAENGTHHIHEKNCSHVPALPQKEDLYFLGAYARKEAAELEASLYFRNTSFCPDCLGN